VRCDGTVCEFASHSVATPPEQKCDTLHGVQMREFSGLYHPFAHVVHSLDPATDTLVALHGVHEEMKLAVNAAENVSIWHSEQKALPFAFAPYVPAAHGTQLAC